MLACEISNSTCDFCNAQAVLGCWNGMSKPPEKHRKLLDLRSHVPHVSKQALESILKYVDKNGLPEKKTAKDMRTASRGVIDEADGHGPLLVHQDVLLQDGSSIQVQFVNLCSFLHSAYKAGGGFYRAMSQMLESTDQLSLCLYSDELCPGNPLSASTGRKCWVIYAGLKEMGPLLQTENAWITLCILRSNVVATVEASMSQIMKRLLHLIFLNPWCDVQDLGICLQPPEGHAGEANRRVRLSLAYIIQDGAAQKMTWSVKGDSGSRFCSLCSNCFSLKQAGDESEDDIDPSSQFTKHSELVLHSSEEMLESWDRMAARYGKCSAKEWSAWQQAAGITFSPESLLACPALRPFLKPTEQWMHDYMHGLLSNGLLSYATFYLLQVMDGWKTFAEYCKFWQLPKQFSAIRICDVLDDKRVVKHKKSGKLNSTASELLSLLPILAQYVRQVCGDKHKKETEAFLSMQGLQEALQAGWSGKLTHDIVFVLVEEALAKWKNAGWPFRRKNHWPLHFSQCVRTHTACISCFAMERKHKQISRKTNLVQNTTHFESSAMREVVTAELHLLAEADSLDNSIGLLGPKAASKKDQVLANMIWPTAVSGQVTIALTARCRDGSVSVGDLALFHDPDHPELKWSCGLVNKFVQHGDDRRCILQRLSMQRLHSHHAAWLERDDPVAVPLLDIYTSVIFAKDAGVYTTLIPWRWR